MIKRIALLMLCVMSFSIYGMVGTKKIKDYANGELLVKFTGCKYNVSSTCLNSIKSFSKVLETLKINILSTISEFNLTRITFPAWYNVNTIGETLKKYGIIEEYTPNILFTITEATIPNDPLFSKQWGHKNSGQDAEIINFENGQVRKIPGKAGADIKMPEAWQIGTGSKKVIVGLVDTGMAIKHPDLKDALWVNEKEIPDNGVDDDNNGYTDDINGWAFDSPFPFPIPLPGFNGSPDVNDVHIHGSHCAGIIGATGNNKIGVSGVNHNVTIMPLRVMNAQGQGTLFAIIDAIKYAADNGAHIISASLGAAQTAPQFEEAVKYAVDKGVLFVAASGNGGEDQIGDDNDATPNYPSNYTFDTLIAVAATDNSDNITKFSNFGKVSVDVAAPGFGIYSTTPKMAEYGNMDYTPLSGTSMATPYVAGLAALIKSINFKLTAIQIKDIILKSADKLPSLNGKILTGGRINAQKAVELAKTY